MKLIIDIPENIEEYIKDYIPIGAGNNVFCYPDEIVRMIQNGTVLPDNATNGDVIKAMFIDVKVNVTKYSYVVEVKLPHHTEHDTGLLFDKYWWNTPYKKEGKG